MRTEHAATMLLECVDAFGVHEIRLGLEDGTAHRGKGYASYMFVVLRLKWEWLTT